MEIDVQVALDLCRQLGLGSIWLVRIDSNPGLCFSGVPLSAIQRYGPTPNEEGAGHRDRVEHPIDAGAIRSTQSWGAGQFNGIANLPLPPIRLRESVIDSVEPLSDPRGHWGRLHMRALQGDLHPQWSFGHPLDTPVTLSMESIAVCYSGGTPLICIGSHAGYIIQLSMLRERHEYTHSPFQKFVEV